MRGSIAGERQATCQFDKPRVCQFPGKLSRNQADRSLAQILRYRARQCGYCPLM